MNKQEAVWKLFQSNNRYENDNLSRNWLDCNIFNIHSMYLFRLTIWMKYWKSGQKYVHRTESFQLKQAIKINFKFSALISSCSKFFHKHLYVCFFESNVRKPLLQLIKISGSFKFYFMLKVKGKPLQNKKFKILRD